MMRDQVRKSEVQHASIDIWPRDQMAPAYDAMKTAPSHAVSLEYVRESLATAHQSMRDSLVPTASSTDFAYVPESPALAENEQSLKEHLLGGPKVDEFEIEPDSDTGREITL